MRLAPFVKIQLAVFAILAIVSTVYGLVSYIGMGRMTGVGTYRVVAEFSDSGGVYESALVTYRGVSVGRVVGVDVDVARAGAPVRVTLQMNSGTPVPKASSATIKSASAVGEQFVDLTPVDGAGGDLVDGDVLPAKSNHVPTPTHAVLEAAKALVADISPTNLDTALGELSTVMDASGERLARLIDSSQSLLHLAQVDLGPTLTLLDDAEPLLTVGNEVAPQLRMSAQNLASFTGQLAASDDPIRQVLEVAPPAADSVSDTLEELTPSLPILLSNLQTVGQVMRVNIPQIRSILTVYPALIAGGVSSLQGFDLGDSPQAPLDVKLGNSLNPPPCTEGYRTVRRDPSEVGTVGVPRDQYCDVNKNNPKVARGARNIPCATDASVRTAFVADCPKGLPSTWSDMLSRPGGASSTEPPPTKKRRATTASRQVPYSDTTGTFRGPDGVTYLLGSIADGHSGEEHLTWQSLLMK
ncbi:MCE family protein [Gordonia sp. (in: high G+C Gram-positive bacteria)]|uniref:MCE family protein n=1 Tax=Gordonia sp. (in: high G+C Gram-positive bacteria) TaxID=84139 RepID=UPI003F9B8B64